jgi:hypothetical protein
LAWSGGAPCLRRIPSHTATTRAPVVGSGQVAQLVGEPDRRQPPAHRADLRPGAGQLGEIPADRGRPGGQWLQTVAGAPGSELRPVAAVTAQRVRCPGRLDVAGLVVGQRQLGRQLERIRLVLRR